MAYTNFIPTIWSAAIQKNLEKSLVFAEDCNRQFEGEVKQQGDQVRILGVGKPTIKSIVRANSSNNIDGPEEIEDTSVTLNVDQIRYFNFMVGDIDKQQAIGGLMDALTSESSEGLANEIDSSIANLAVADNVTKLYVTTPALVSGTASSGQVNVLDALDAAIEKLYENDVNPKSKIVVTVSPRFHTLFKRAYVTKDTDNSAMLKNGVVGMYGNVVVKLSNNVKRSTTTAANDTDNIMIRTQRAIAYVNPLTKTEAYRPESKFADAIKGFTLYGTKVVRPKELININVKYT